MDIYYQRRVKSILNKKPIDFYMIWYYSFYIKNSENELISKIFLFKKKKNKENKENDMISTLFLSSSLFFSTFSYVFLGNLMVKLGISLFLIKKYDSVLILLIFWPFSSLIHQYFQYFLRKSKKTKANSQSNSYNDCYDCYFCQIRKNYLKNKIKYEVYDRYLHENKEKVAGFETEINKEYKNNEEGEKYNQAIQMKVDLIMEDFEREVIKLI